MMYQMLDHEPAIATYELALALDALNASPDPEAKEYR